MYDICIIGAGPSGLAAAIESSRRGLSCVVVDRNKKPLKKLYATGNGRCNLTNDVWDDNVYYENSFVDSVYDALYEKTGLRPRNFILKYFEELGIKTVNIGGYYYPMSLQASSVSWAILDALKTENVEIIKEFEVSDIIRNPEGYFEIISKDNTVDEINRIYARKIVLSIGGLSGKGLGEADIETTIGLLNSLDIEFNFFVPGLCPVLIEDDLSLLSGVRFKAGIKIDNHYEEGEVQVTDYGLSGIVIFNMSRYVEKDCRIHIDVIHNISKDDFINSFTEIKKVLPDRSLVGFLNGFINDKLAKYFAYDFLGELCDSVKIKDMNEEGIAKLYDNLTDWCLTVSGRSGFDSSQATIGGIKTELINPKTMNLFNNNDIYVTGEITDVMGKCGGYNLTYAFISGYLAGNSIKL